MKFTEFSATQVQVAVSRVAIAAASHWASVKARACSLSDQGPGGRGTLPEVPGLEPRSNLVGGPARGAPGSPRH